jgi:hypothetical protein
MIEVKAPNRSGWDAPCSVFLGGSIEMGKASDWQDKLKNDLAQYNVVLFNPRREYWDSSMVQSISNPEFNEQVSWELEHIELADLVVFYFDPLTQSPVTLMEVGLCAGLGKASDVIVCCPDGYFRKGNLEIVCSRYGMPILETYNSLVETLHQRLSYYN